MRAFRHADGGLYCLADEDVEIKHPDTGAWLRGIGYRTINERGQLTDRKLYVTTVERWRERFAETTITRK